MVNATCDDSRTFYHTAGLSGTSRGSSPSSFHMGHLNPSDEGAEKKRPRKALEGGSVIQSCAVPQPTERAMLVTHPARAQSG